MGIIEKALARKEKAGKTQDRTIDRLAVGDEPAGAAAAPGGELDEGEFSLSPLAAFGAESGQRRPASARIELDYEKLRDAGMVVPDTTRSRIKEEYRHIKRPLLMNVAGRGAQVVNHANLVMISSAVPGEGKTFSAVNLAMSIAAERDRTVLAVDADILRPTLSAFFALEDRPGLVDYIFDDELDMADVLVKTDTPNLTILPAGNAHHLTTELLASENMERLTEELATRYHDRIVVFDSPPILGTSEARVLAGLMGQVVLVVRSGKTRESQVREALSYLGEDAIVGIILNRTRRGVGSGYYEGGYYYYSYYGYGHG